MSEEHVYLLCLAIIKRAIKDYKAVCSARPDSADALRRDDLESFFRGPWFAAMAGELIDPETLMSMVRCGEVHVNFNFEEINR